MRIALRCDLRRRRARREGATLSCAGTVRGVEAGGETFAPDPIAAGVAGADVVGFALGFGLVVLDRSVGLRAAPAKPRRPTKSA